MTSPSTRLPALGFALLVAGAAPLSCRSGGLCDTLDCGAELTGSGGMAGDRSDVPAGSVAGERSAQGGAGGDPSEGAGGDPSGGAGGDPSGGASGAANGGESGQPAGMTCEGDLADCDDSRLTACETDLSWNVRHCGACGNDCDGACVFGRCEPATLVDRLFAEMMVASPTTGFAQVTDGYSEGDSIVEIDMESGESKAVQPNIPEDVQLVLGADRVYFFHTDTSEVFSTRLDGNSTELNKELDDADDFGASPLGAYRVRAEADPETSDESESLWFRPTGATAWRKLRAAADIELHHSSASGVVASEYDAEGAGLLLLLEGPEVRELGAEPAGFREAIAVGDSVVVLTADYDAGESTLHWLTADTSSSYAIELVSYGDHLVPRNDEVAIRFESNGKAVVNFYGRGGLTIGNLGIAPHSTLVFADSLYLWYGVYDNWLEPRFLRARWLNLLP